MTTVIRNISGNTRKPGLLILSLIILLSILNINSVEAQCGYAAGLGCPGTDYNNYGFNSNNNAASIEYDNNVTGYLQSVARTSSGDFMIWGQYAANNGVSAVLTPQIINSTNYPALTGIVLKAGIGSGADHHQLIVLTTTGLFAGGEPGLVLSTIITNTSAFSKLTINGESDGLPAGVEPTEVKMLFVTYKTIAITTCSGEVWVLSQVKEMRGNGATGTGEQWSKVITSDIGGPAFSGIVATRGSATALIALKNDNTIWTWGKYSFLGNGSSYSTVNTKATQMTAPGAGTIKMIGGTSDGTRSSYYVLYTSGVLYGLGDNAKNQLGDWTSTERTSWIQPRYTSASGPYMNDIQWIAPMEHDRKYPYINVINTSKNLYNWGAEDGYALGRGNTTETYVNPGIPGGLTTTDHILTVESGGHTTMITAECQEKIGFVGQRLDGSMAAGGISPGLVGQFFYSTDAVPTCGAKPMIDAWGITDGPTGKVCQSSKVLINATPAGGVLTLVSGPGILTGNELTFTGAGSVVLQYTITSACGVDKSIKRTFETEPCTLYKVKGKVWFDGDENAIIDVGENGTNTGAALIDGVWANLVAADSKVAQSVPVSHNGDYELATINSGTFAVRVTNQEIGKGTIIASTSENLPANWQYTGNNTGIPCVVPACADPGVISNIILDSGTPEVNNFDFGITNRILPIKLVNFSAVKTGKTSTLTWTTAIEQNNSGFEIQRRVGNNNTWSRIGFVASSAEDGNSQSERGYRFIDHDPATGLNQYRLRQIDFDGRSSFSDIRTVQFSGVYTTLAVYPNPTSDVVKITGLSGNELIKVIDFTGRQLIRQPANGLTEEINLSRFGNGIYQIIITGKNGENNVFKVMKR